MQAAPPPDAVSANTAAPTKKEVEIRGGKKIEDVDDFFNGKTDANAKKSKKGDEKKSDSTIAAMKIDLDALNDDDFWK